MRAVWNCRVLSRGGLLGYGRCLHQLKMGAHSARPRRIARTLRSGDMRVSKVGGTSEQSLVDFKFQSIPRVGAKCGRAS